MEQYYRCKRKLFAQCDFAVICTDTLWGTRLAQEISGSFVAVSADDATVDAASDAVQTVFRMCRAGRRVTARMPLTGRYNLSNALCAVAAAERCGVHWTDALDSLATLPVIPGRMERLVLDTPFEVFIDYAHTPEALKQVLTALRPVCAARLTVVFGCGGDRDRSKRPEMGRIASMLADRVILTDDNPRSENPERIRADIAAGITGEVRQIADRAEAITAAIREASPGDVVLIAGKGHEQYQIFSNGVRPLNEYRIAAEAAAVWKKERNDKHGTD
jgi:UDP-N-acetylmuramoyl-L-alanyl-D-glutamate--2,6-diaminopimelate ligase